MFCTASYTFIPHDLNKNSVSLYSYYITLHPILIHPSLISKDQSLQSLLILLHPILLLTPAGLLATNQASIS